MSHSMLEVLLGCTECLAGFVLLWATMRITTAAGFTSSQRRWALFRRIVYGSQAIALFGLGLAHLDSYTITEGLKLFFQFIIMFGVVAFPVLRAFGWITQDQFQAVDGSYQRGSWWR